MSLHNIIKDIQNWFHSLVKDLKPALDFLETNGGEAALTLAESVVSSAAAGTPWDEIVAQFILAAESAGIALVKGTAEQAASIILNMAKANLDAKTLS